MFLSNQMLSRKGMFPPTKLSRFSSLIMVRRCVFGCSNARTLFCFPTTNWLRKKWLEFIHFEEEAICASSRLCDRHFSDEFFTNLGMVTAGITCYLTLADTAVPTLYTVGPSPPARPMTREVGCQCNGPVLKSVAVQAVLTQKKPKRRSKAIQVRPFGSTSASVSCSDEDFPFKSESSFTSTPIKRPRMEDSSEGTSYSSEEPTDDTHVPDIIQEEDIK
ncbi:piggyBac transposable element-derived protein 4-like [Pimephales promelas]|nr:piggyBac transposable element-derived protein 4-like [Pimephales promelas]